MTRGGPAEEWLFMNYPEPRALHDYRFLGANFRERERIKRKTERWRSRIASLPELEHLALFSAMAADLAGNDAIGSTDTSDVERRPESSFLMIGTCIDRPPSAKEVLQ
jgi:hypothetical protein